MIDIRWHSADEKSALMGAQVLASVAALVGKQVQAFSIFHSGTKKLAMTAYTRINYNETLKNKISICPSYVLVLDPELAFTEDITLDCNVKTKYIITTPIKDKAEFINKTPLLNEIQDNIYILDMHKMIKETIDQPVKHFIALGAYIKLSQMTNLYDFKRAIKKVLAKSPEQILETNILAFQQGYDQVNQLF